MKLCIGWRNEQRRGRNKNVGKLFNLVSFIGVHITNCPPVLGILDVIGMRGNGFQSFERFGGIKLWSHYELEMVERVLNILIQLIVWNSELTHKVHLTQCSFNPKAISYLGKDNLKDHFMSVFGCAMQTVQMDIQHYDERRFPGYIVSKSILSISLNV